MKVKFQEVLHSLPREIKSYNDIEILVRAFGQVLLGNKHSFKAAQALIDESERLYFICDTNIKIKEVRGPDILSMPGVIFISDKRVVIRRWIDESVIEFPLEEIHSVDVKNGILTGKFSFCTAKQRVDFIIAYDKLTSPLLGDLLIRAAETAQNNAPQAAGPNSFASGGCVVKVIECKSCAATVLVRLGQLNQCEYCNRFVDGDVS